MGMQSIRLHGNCVCGKAHGIGISIHIKQTNERAAKFSKNSAIILK